MELRPFDPHVVCPGCGTQPSHTRPAALRYCVRPCEALTDGIVGENARGSPVFTRHLHWICAGCGYEDLMVCAPDVPPRHTEPWTPPRLESPRDPSVFRTDAELTQLRAGSTLRLLYADGRPLAVTKPDGTPATTVTLLEARRADGRPPVVELLLHP